MLRAYNYMGGLLPPHYFYRKPMQKHNDGRLSSAQLKRLADFVQEASMLKNIPRSGFAFLGSGRQNVAEHSYQAAVFGYVLARMAGIDPARVAFLCLFHDLHEARTGDFNYVNHRYNSCRARDALMDASSGTGLEKELLAYWDELEGELSEESLLAGDADQLDLILMLHGELARGNEFARDWLDSALQRLKTQEGRELAEAILQSSPHRWWYDGVEQEWWINHGK